MDPGLRAGASRESKLQPPPFCCFQLRLIQRIQEERENGSVIAGSPNQMPGIRARDVVKRDTRPFVFSTKSLSCRSINPGDQYKVASWP